MDFIIGTPFWGPSFLLMIHQDWLCEIPPVTLVMTRVARWPRSRFCI
ncbi:MAG: hypothetical protein H6669_05155 [Ardenticatenaceae bacterium]|nr:hypothetical protein [Ardenticatenaceae bacterium]